MDSSRRRTPVDMLADRPIATVATTSFALGVSASVLIATVTALTGDLRTAGNAGTAAALVGVLGLLMWGIHAVWNHFAGRRQAAATSRQLALLVERIDGFGTKIVDRVGDLEGELQESTTRMARVEQTLNGDGVVRRMQRRTRDAHDDLHYTGPLAAPTRHARA